MTATAAARPRRHKAVEYIPRETESHFQAELLRLAHALGYRTYHTNDSRRSVAGFPDLVLVHRHKRRVIFAELKRNNEQPQPDQREWHSDLEWCEQEVYVWRPADWTRIVEILTAGGRS
jgi:hypothetical protein